MKVSIKEAAKELGVSIVTLRRWEATGKIKSERTVGGHRRYELSDIVRFAKVPKTDRITVAYARVSTSDQKEDLKRQTALLDNYCTSKGWTYEIIQDLGSGLNYRKKGLNKLINQIVQNKIERIVLTNKDRLLRFGAEIIFTLCEKYGTEVVIINSSSDVSFEEELVQDVLEIITVFSARLYGSRSHKNKKVMAGIKGVVNDIRSNS